MCVPFYMLYLLSSSYLLVIGDDRVHVSRWCDAGGSGGA